MLKFLVKDREVIKAEEEKTLINELGLTREEIKEAGYELLSPLEYVQKDMTNFEDENVFADWI